MVLCTFQTAIFNKCMCEPSIVASQLVCYKKLCALASDQVWLRQCIHAVVSMKWTLNSYLGSHFWWTSHLIKNVNSAGKHWATSRLFICSRAEWCNHLNITIYDTEYSMRLCAFIQLLVIIYKNVKAFEISNKPKDSTFIRYSSGSASTQVCRFILSWRFS